MIPLRQVLDLRAEWQLRADVIEKDYVLGWLLAAIASTDQLAGTWVFKGGTCLRKCYFETYRFSEDLDFTVTGGDRRLRMNCCRSSGKSRSGCSNGRALRSKFLSTRSSGAATSGGTQRPLGVLPFEGQPLHRLFRR